MSKNLLILMLFALAINAFGQGRTISGQVTSADDGAMLPGVNVIVKGTAQGTTTDAMGSYKLTMPSSEGILIFSFIGFISEEVDVRGLTVVDVRMRPDVTQLAEVVVTAQGIERDQRSLGYAVQHVKGSEVAQRSEVNLLNTLQGKLSGVNITGASGGAGSSTNINIRGVTSFSGSNQPLIVVDGIVFNNDIQAVTGMSTVFSHQPSNRLNDISPENIESITVLKGPNASVLYGSRAANGVIIITTRQGSKASGKTEVTLTSSVNFQDVTGLPKLQNAYGQGLNNSYVSTTPNSWGPAFGGDLSEVETIQGDLVPYKAFPDNVKGFFRQGRIIQNGLNIVSGDRDRNVGVSISSTIQDGIIPNTEFTRNSAQLSGTSKLDNGVKISSSITYVQSTQSSLPQGNGGSALGQITRIPRSYDLMGRPYKNVTNQSIYYSDTQRHPLWSSEFEKVNSTLDRAFGFLTVGYDVKPWLNVSYRVTGDTYLDRRKVSIAIGAARQPQGLVQEMMIYNSEFNGDLLVTASRDNFLLDGLSASLLAGHNINHRANQNTNAQAQGLTIPGFDNLNNGSVFTGTQDTRQIRRLVGTYADLNLNYKNYLFLGLQGRIDKSSTLPEQNNRFFYPGVSVSFVPTDAFGISSNFLSYTKVRASVGKTGKDANPYLLTSFYQARGQGNNVANIDFPMNIGGASIPGFFPELRIGSNSLTPEFTTSYEGGVNVGLFKGRVAMEIGYFYSESENQIFNVAISPSSGFNTQTSNVGLITNRGWEFELSGTPVNTGSFTWEVAMNWTRIRNKIVRITEGVTSSVIDAGNTFNGISPSIVEGLPYGVIVGTAITRNDAGQPLINSATGLFVPGTPNTPISNPNPDWVGGLSNTFSYKNISLMALVDVKYGHDLYSFGWIDLRSNGSLAITGNDRELPRILPGVIDNGDGTFTENYIQLPAQSYWQGLGGLASEAAVFDATTIRLREVSVSYQLPANLLSKSPFGSVSFGVSARNLWFHSPYAPGDPELNTQGAGNIQGLDLNGAPNTRNYGFNLRITL